MGRTDFSTIIPSLAPETDDLVLDRLLSPARHYKHPDDVLRDSTLNPGEKRAILSSWASDACAVESMPALRHPPGAGQPISFDAIMDALQCLDALARQQKREQKSYLGQDRSDWMREAGKGMKE